MSDAPATGEDHLRVTAAFAVKYGLDRQEALRALTVVPAEALGLAKRLGSIEAEKLTILAHYPRERAIAYARWLAGLAESDER